jgi:hypothetical protein
VHEALATALAAVLHDVTVAGGIIPQVRDEQWSDVPGQECAVLYWADGSGFGVHVMLGESPDQQLASLADQVQDGEVGQLPAERLPATWPECPRHPNSHPMSAVALDGAAVWVCPKDSWAISRVGELSGPPARRG